MQRKCQRKWRREQANATKCNTARPTAKSASRTQIRSAGLACRVFGERRPFGFVWQQERSL